MRLMAEDEELFHHEVTPWTVGDLRRALDGLPDHLPVVVNIAEDPGGDTALEQVITGAGFGTIRRRVGPGEYVDEVGPDGYIDEVDSTLGIDCQFPTGDYYR